jgi:urease accessory protein
VTLTLTQKLAAPPDAQPICTLSLTAEERSRSRFPCKGDQGIDLYLNLPRGTTLRDGDWLRSEQGEWALVRAKPEPVLTVTANNLLDLLQAAYHLGNRHVPLEIAATHLRLSPDSVLQHLLEHRGLHITTEIAPFQPETGAYSHSH